MWFFNIKITVVRSFLHSLEVGEYNTNYSSDVQNKGNYKKLFSLKILENILFKNCIPAVHRKTACGFYKAF